MMIKQSVSPDYTTSVVFKSKLNIDWDINDTIVPKVSEQNFDEFCEWANGHCRLVY